MDSSFRNDIGVEAVTKVDGVDVVAGRVSWLDVIAADDEVGRKLTIPDRCT